MTYAYGKNYQNSKCPYAKVKLRGNVYYTYCHCKENPRNLGLGVKMNKHGGDLSHNATRCLGRNIQGIGTFRDCEYYQLAKHGKVRKTDNAKTFKMGMDEYFNPNQTVRTTGFLFVDLFKSLFSINFWLICFASIFGVTSGFLIKESRGYYPAKLLGVILGVLTVLIVIKLFKRRMRK